MHSSLDTVHIKYVCVCAFSCACNAVYIQLCVWCEDSLSSHMAFLGIWAISSHWVYPAPGRQAETAE